jgi:hypothetical protein
MTWTWSYVGASGEPCGTSREFASQDEAEAWLSSSWKELEAGGIAEVELADGGQVSYRMKLEEE